MKRLYALLVLPCLVCVTACGIRIGCDDSLTFGLAITVVDDATEADICDAQVTAVDDDYSEILQSQVCPGPYVGAGERAGTYRISVDAPGYEPKVIDDVDVDSMGCHVENTAIVARLRAR